MSAEPLRVVDATGQVAPDVYVRVAGQAVPAASDAAVRQLTESWPLRRVYEELLLPDLEALERSAATLTGYRTALGHWERFVVESTTTPPGAYVPKRDSQASKAAESAPQGHALSGGRPGIANTGPLELTAGEPGCDGSKRRPDPPAPGLVLETNNGPDGADLLVFSPGSAAVHPEGPGQGRLF